TALVAVAWAIAAWWLARELPALAIAHVAEGGARDDTGAVDDRAIRALVADLAGARGDRAADVLARLHERGRFDAAAALARAACERGTPGSWRALVAVLAERREPLGPVLLDAARAAKPAVRELAVRAVGLAGGVPAEAIEQWRDHEDPAVALAAEVAQLRLRGEQSAIGDLLGDSARDPGDVARAAIDELVVELARGADALAAARSLARALRRGRGTPASRAAALHALGKLVATAKSSAELVLLRADLLELVRDLADAPAGEPIETAAALGLYGTLLEGQGAIEPDDLRRVAAALGERDDDVRGAAEHALAALGVAAASELIATAAWGRRLARDRAAALLAELPVTPATLDRLVDAELDALERTSGALAAFSDDALVARRLEERLHEIAHTVLLLVAARGRSRSIARAASQWRHARGAHERARTLAVIEAALPRPLVGRLVEVVDAIAPADRAAAIAAAGGTPPTREAAIRGELAGRDRLARALVLHALGEGGRGAHRETIARAAHAEALSASPADLVRRLTEAISEPEPAETEGADMPTRVETLIALGRVPLLASLTTRQLADVAERARWVTAREGTVVVSAGDPIDALIAVDDGELRMGDRTFGKGDVVDELACVAPLAASADLVVVRAARVIRLERVDFEELVDDVPGLASAVCRGLGERARRAADASYRSPLASRIG
ncbi:MAG TPA: cyclic nucleotide-binding domain-containing protein, partial [Kofleriaceae bacterium]|nr:cyclic nucleotide-binding domain-containing protein [Kofleriaceae bacterium]